MLLRTPIMQGRKPGFFLEKSPKGGRIWKMKLIGYFLHGLVRVLQQEHAAANDGPKHQFLYRISHTDFDKAERYLGVRQSLSA